MCGKVLCCVFCGVDGVVHMDRLILVLPKMRTRRAIIQVNHLYHIISYIQWYFSMRVCGT